MRYVPIAGTNEKKVSWCSPGSDFDQHLMGRGFVRYADKHQLWSRALAGTFFTASGHQVWEHGGQDVDDYLFQWSPEELSHTVVIAHSYGGAVLAYALARSPYLRTHLGAIITVGTPVRRDLDKVWAQARESNMRHIHLYGTGWGARIRWFGQRGRLKREMPWANVNMPVKGGHSGVVRKLKHIPQIDAALDAVGEVL